MQRNRNYKGIVRIAGNAYECEVINGVRYINGMTFDKFIDTLDIDTVTLIAKLGEAAIQFERAELPFPAQATLDSLDKDFMLN